MVKRTQEYKDYVKKHIETVQKVWESAYSRLLEMHGMDKLLDIPLLIKKHDKSKLSKEEFPEYRQMFFPVDGESIKKKKFNYAWNHHQKANPHHWQYWIMWKADESIVLEMPFDYVIEMLCDWTAMSVEFGGEVSNFYNDNKNKMFLHDKTVTIIEPHLPLFDDVYLELK